MTPDRRPDSGEDYQGCPLYQAKGACYCSTGVPGKCHWLEAQIVTMFGVGSKDES